MSGVVSSDESRRAGVALALAALVLTLGSGCVPAYHPPMPEEPHAIVKLRRTYEVGRGTTLREQLLVDGHSAYDGMSAAVLAGTAHTDSILVWPVQAGYAFRSSFFHTEMQQVNETYYEQVSSFESESYSCGSSGSYQTCTRMVTREHMEPRQRWVTREVDVSDGQCETGMRFSAMVNHVYLLQYTYQDAGACSLACFEQVPQSDGTFENRPCLVALPPPPQ
jgi:hypothetical protein